MSNMKDVKPSRVKPSAVASSRVAPTERIRGRTLQRIRQRVIQDQPSRVKPSVVASSRVAPTERIRGRTLQRIRQRVMQGQPLCRMCDAKGFVTPGAEMDHIVPLFKGGSNDDDNLQMLCVECHRKKSANDLGVAYKPTIGLDGWPIGPQTGGAVEKSGQK